MLTFVYSSNRKQEMYLYIERKDDFDNVPKDLLNAFGPPQFVLTLNLAKRESLAREDIQKVRAALRQQGFFLQMPPKVESLLPSKELKG